MKIYINNIPYIILHTGHRLQIKKKTRAAIIIIIIVAFGIHQFDT